MYSQPQMNQGVYSQPQMNQGMYGQPQMNQGMYSQPQMNQNMYGQPQMNQNMYGQPQMNQSMYGQPQMNQGMYGQPQMNQGMYGQQMGYGQYGYQQPQPSKLKENVKKVKKDFSQKFSKMGLSTFCLIGIIAAMLLIVGPFMNFASLHFNEKFEYEDSYSGYYYSYDYDIEMKLKASDGLNLFELSKLSNTLDGVIDEANDELDFGMDKDDLSDELEDIEDELVDEMEDETDMDFEKLGKEAVGTLQLLLKGQLPLMITPWLIIVSGIGLLIFTVINNKKMKLICSIVPLACMVWLIICSTNFLSYMGIGAIAITIGVVGGIVSAIKDATI